MNTLELLTQLKATNGAASDYRVAQLLGVKPQTISNWKSGRSTMGDEVGVKAAEMLGLDPAKVLIDLHIERVKGDATSHVWKDIGRRLEMAAMPVVVGLLGYAGGMTFLSPLI